MITLTRLNGFVSILRLFIEWHRRRLIVIFICSARYSRTRERALSSHSLTTLTTLTHWASVLSVSLWELKHKYNRTAAIQTQRSSIVHYSLSFPVSLWLSFVSLGALTLPPKLLCRMQTFRAIQTHTLSRRVLSIYFSLAHTHTQQCASPYHHHYCRPSTPYHFESQRSAAVSEKTWGKRGTEKNGTQQTKQ